MIMLDKCTVSNRAIYNAQQSDVEFLLMNCDMCCFFPKSFIHLIMFSKNV